MPPVTVADHAPASPRTTIEEIRTVTDEADLPLCVEATLEEYTKFFEAAREASQRPTMAGLGAEFAKKKVKVIPGDGGIRMQTPRMAELSSNPMSVQVGPVRFKGNHPEFLAYLTELCLRHGIALVYSPEPRLPWAQIEYDLHLKETASLRDVLLAATKQSRAGWTATLAEKVTPQVLGLHFAFPKRRQEEKPRK